MSKPNIDLNTVIDSVLEIGGLAIVKNEDGDYSVRVSVPYRGEFVMGDGSSPDSLASAMLDAIRSCKAKIEEM